MMLGAVITSEESWLPVRSMIADLGHCAGPDDIFFGLRGMRTLSVRLERHQKNATEVAHWLQSRPEVSRVLYPALPEDPGHALWKRDFLGASGLFGVVLKPAPKAAVDAFIDSLDLFGIGASWGGYESLIQPSYPERSRTATRWQAEGPLVRIHIGLEDPQDLIADLTQGLDRLLDDRTLSPRRHRRGGVRRASRHPCLGAGPARRRPDRRGRGRLSPDRPLGVCDRQPPRQLARLPCARFPAGRLAAPAAEWASAGAHDGVPQIRGEDHRQLARARAARHRQRQLCARRPFRAAALYRGPRQL